MKRITHILSALLVCVLLLGMMPAVALAADAPGDFANAQPINVNTSYSDNISDAEDLDYFRFALPNAGTVDVTFTRKNLVDKNEYWGIEIYNEKTEQICYYSIDGLSASSTTYTVGLDRGTYYIRIQGGNFSYGYSHRFVTDTYTFRVNFKAANCEHELNEKPADATSIELNTSYVGSINYDKDIDYYKVTIPQAGIINLTFGRKKLSDTNEYWGIEVYNEKTERICFYSIDGLSESSTTYTVGLDRGTYYIRIQGGNFSYGYSHRFVTDTYTFCVNFKAANCEQELNEQPADATNIELNTSYVGSINYDKDIDYYKVKIPQAGTINLTFGRKKLSNTSEYWGIEVYNEKTEQICFYSIDGLNESSTTYTVGLDRGTYYIRIQGGSFSYGYSHRFVTDTYTFRVNFKAANCEHELNEKPADATSIVLNTSYVGSINRDEDLDYYKVVLPRAGVLDLTFNRNNLENPAEYWQITIYNDQTKQLYTFSVNGLTKSSTFHTNQLSSGTYYIKVNGGSFSYDYSHKFVTDSYSFMLSMQCAGGSGCPSHQFTDVPKSGNWAHAGIDFVLKHGLFAGTSKTKFSPNSPMTRAMLVTVLWRLDGKPSPRYGNSFSDVKNGQWYTNAIRWASEKNIVSGVGGSKFNPNGNITREQMAAILFRYAKFKGYDVSDRGNLNGFPDVSKVSAYAKEALSWANVNGLITGTTLNGTTVLNPRGNATRAQVASILMRYVQNIVEK